MPPKKAKDGAGKKGKKGKKKSAEAAPELSPEAVETQQLKDLLRTMKGESETETRLLNDFQQQKEKIDKFWELEKTRREDMKLELRNKFRQKQDLEEKHAFELKVYKEKVKHLLYEQQTALTEAKLDAESSISIAQAAQRSVQHEEETGLRQIKRRQKELEISQYDLVNNQKQEQEKNIMLLRQEYERRFEELKARFRKQERTVRNDFQERRKQDIFRIISKKDAKTAKLMLDHKKAFEEIKNYYRDITHNNLDLIKSLKEEVQTMRKKEQSDQKDVSEIRRTNKKLSQPLQKNLALVEDLTHDLKQYEKEKAALAAVKERLALVEKQIQDLSWEHEILEQKFEQLVEERDELKDKFENTVYDVQQKAGFKHIVVKEKLAALTFDLEKTEAALAEVLSSTNLNPEVIGNIQRNLEDVLAAKNKAIAQMEDRVADLKAHYYDTIHIFNCKLDEYGIAQQDLGFQPPII